MIKHNAILIISLYIVCFLLGSFYFVYLNYQNNNYIIESSEIVSDDIEINGNIVFFKNNTSRLYVLEETEKKLEDIRITVSDISDEKITCQIYFTTKSMPQLSAENASSLTVLTKGNNIIDMPSGFFNSLILTFRTADVETAFIEIEALEFTDNVNYKLFFLMLFLFLTVLFAVVFLMVALKKEVKANLLKAVEHWINSNRKVIAALVALVSTLGYDCRYENCIIDVPGAVNSAGYFLKKITAVFTNDSPTTECVNFIAMLVLVYVVLGKIEKKIKLTSFILSLMITFFTMMGDSFRVTDSWDLLFTTDYAQIVINIIIGCALFLIFYILTAYLFEATEKFHEDKAIAFHKNKLIVKFLDFYNRHTIGTLAVIMLIAWLPYMIVYYPGIIPSDATRQIEMWFSGGEWSNASPVFSTFTLCMPIELGGLLGSDNFGVFLFTSVQAIVLSIVLSYAIVLLKKYNVPAIIYRIWFLSILILPVYPCSAIQLGKDTNFTICVLLFIIFLFKIIKESDSFFASWKFSIFMAVSMIYMCLVRHNGIYLVIPSIFIIFLFIKKRNYFIKIVSCFLCTIIATFAFNAITPAIIENNNEKNGIVATEEKDYAFSTVFLSVANNITGRIVLEHGFDLSEERIRVLNKVYTSTERLGQVYNPELSDYATAQWLSNVTETDIEDYKELFWDLVIEYPETAAEAFFNKCYSYLYSNSASKAKGYVWLGVNTYMKSIEEVSIYNNQIYMGYNMILYAYMNTIMSIPVFSVLSYVGIYTWIIIFAVFVLLSKKDFKSLFVVLPILLSLGVCVMSPVNGYIRYALPIIMGAPILFALCFKEKKVS